MLTKKSILLSGVAVSSLAIGFLPPKELSFRLFQTLTYYFLSFLFFFWLVRLYSVLKTRLVGFLRLHYPAVVIAILLMTAIYGLCPPRFKILADEANLIGVSLSMHLNRTTSMPIEGVFIDYATPEFSEKIDKRPGLYPFLVSCVHSVIGYSPRNGFVLNFVVGAGVLIGIYVSVVTFLPQWFGIAAMLLVASTPCFVICSTSSGFEVLNLLYLILTSLALIGCLKTDAGTPETELLFLTLILLAQCRYESVIFIPIIGIAVLPFLVRRRYFQRTTYLACAVPVFLVPLIWQRRVFAGLPEINKFGEGLFQRAESIFSLRNFFSQIDDNIFVLLGLDPNYGFTPLLALLSIIGMYIMVRNFLVRRSFEGHGVLVVVATSSFVALLVLISSFFWGRFTIPMDNRLALVFLPYLAWSASYGTRWVFKTLMIRSGFVICLVFVFHVLFYWPYGAQQRLINRLSLQYEYAQSLAYLDQHYPTDGTTLILAEQPNLYIIQGYSAYRLVNATDMLNKLQEGVLVNRIVALQKVDPMTGLLHKNSVPNAHLEMHPVETLPISPSVVLRISECRPKPG